jgi:hypothetical protein
VLLIGWALGRALLESNGDSARALREAELILSPL